MSYGSHHQISIFFGLKKPYAPSQRKKADIMGLDCPRRLLPWAAPDADSVPNVESLADARAGKEAHAVVGLRTGHGGRSPDGTAALGGGVTGPGAAVVGMVWGGLVMSLGAPPAGGRAGGGAVSAAERRGSAVLGVVPCSI
jgi:hypothetical protein